MLGSDHDGECCNAARLACRLLRTHGLTWEQALQADSIDERGTTATNLCNCRGLLSSEPMPRRSIPRLGPCHLGPAHPAQAAPLGVAPE
jgi:hypothetical protein